MFGKKEQEKATEAMSAEEIRTMREEERLNSVYPDESPTKSKIKKILKYAAFAIFAVLLFAAFFLLSGFLSSTANAAMGYLSVIDNTSGFLFEAVTKLLHLIGAAVVTSLLGFSFKKRIDKNRKNNEDEFKWVGICAAVALGADVLFLLISRLTGDPQLIVNGSTLSQIMYYLTKIVLVPLSNITFYVVLPSMIMEFVSSLIFDSKAQIRIPMMVFSTIMLAAGQLGMSWAGISGAGFMITLYALIQSAACSVLYHRTQKMWLAAMLYALVTALYYPLSWLLYLI